MIEMFRDTLPIPKPFIVANINKINVCIRKRPIFEKELAYGEIDSVTCVNPKSIIHETRLKVDGITKFLQNTDFTFDCAYGEHDSSEEIYGTTLQPLTEYIIK
jgi:kinesin family protein 2/24